MIISNTSNNTNFYQTVLDFEKYAKFLAKKWKGLISEEIYNILIEYKVEQ